MNAKQLLFVVLILSVITIALLLEIGENHINNTDVVGIVAFLSGAGAVIGLTRLGGDE